MIYSSIFITKNNQKIPLFTDGKPMHSRYNPDNEAAAFLKSVENSINGKFIIIGGIGGGYHIKEIAEKYFDCKIIAFEIDKESLDFCLQLDEVKNLSEKVIFCSLENLERVICSNYIPSLYGNASIIFQRSWQNEIDFNKIQETIQETLKSVSADYSVQSYFGKIWQRNILINLQNLKSNLFKINEADFKKTCAVIAAGPSLDKTISKIKDKRNEYFIISTDTSLPVLLENKIIPEAVISVDSQTVSHTHFLTLPERKTEGITFIFDISTNPENVKYIKDKGYDYYFISSGHPLAEYLGKDFLMHIDSGNGTVTAAACDFAFKAGFSEIELFGADFCYNNFKPYSKGTYLDRNFNFQSSRNKTSEQIFSALMYRTELLEVKESFTDEKLLTASFTSPVMEAYEKGMKFWCKENNFSAEKNLLHFNGKNSSRLSSVSEINIEGKMLLLKKKLEEIIEKNNYSDEDLEYLIPVLPYISWCRKTLKNKEKTDFFDFLKLAYNALLRYTLSYES